MSYIKGIIDEGYDGQSDGILDVSSGGNPIFRENSKIEDNEADLPDEDENITEDMDNDETQSAEDSDNSDDLEGESDNSDMSNETENIDSGEESEDEVD